MLRTPSLCRIVVVPLLLAPSGCEGGPTGPRLAEADVRILFVGNSLTYANRMPELVATAAQALGRDVSVATIALPDFSLEDHWRNGIADELRALAPDVVIMQQGPSSLAQNQVHLRAWADSLARVARSVGAAPALLMVWPSADRLSAFDDVRASYLGAAEAIDGLFVPAGEAWRRAWELDPELALFGPDGFHPSRLGSAVAALAVVRTLFDEPLAGLPRELVPASAQGASILLTEAEAAVLYRAVDETVELWSRGALEGG
jgi:hypothetical protein